MKKMFRGLIYVLAIVVPVLAAGLLGSMYSMETIMGDTKNRPAGFSSSQIEPPAYEPEKPTVAVMAGSDNTEILDFLIPYELFSTTNAFNVFAVAPTNDLTSLSGGLDVIPHYAFTELDNMIGKSPDVIVVPAIFNMEKEGYPAVREYIQKHANSETIILSICAGADNLADAGLLNNIPATTHFGDMNRLAKKYPEVRWTEGQRYVAHENIVTTAGVTSAIDGSLFVISELIGEEAAKQAAATLNYPDFHYVQDPSMEQFQLGLPDSIVILNGAFHWINKQDGVLLYEGIQETALGTIFDTHTVSGTTSTYTVGETIAPVKTQYGLYLVPRHDMKTMPDVDRLLVSGTTGFEEDATYKTIANMVREDTDIVHLHQPEPERFILEHAIEDLAKQTNKPTAAFAAKRLEYRADDLQLEGKSMAMGITAVPMLIMLGSLFLAIVINHRIMKRK